MKDFKIPSSLNTYFLKYLFQVPFLPGESDLGQLSKIFETLGTPTEADWKVCFDTHIVFIN